MSLARRLGLVLALLALALTGVPAHAAARAPGVLSPPTAVARQDDILARLQRVPGLTVAEAASPVPGRRVFHLTLTQPVDHAHPDGPTFRQRLTLQHRADTAPMVLYTGGYSLYGDGFVHETTQLLDGNQLFVEHRYFTPSRPVPTDWSHLTIRQAASDLHRVVGLLRPVYPGTRWISSGISKDGMTSVYHRRFYPHDVDGTVAYVAPLSFGAPDQRYVRFLDTQPGTPSCRRALRGFQRHALLRRAALAALLRDRAAADHLTFGKLGLDKALEHSVVEVPFAFWQYLDASYCAKIPPAGASVRRVFDFIDLVSEFRAFSDQGIAPFEPYYYQAATQLGYPREPEWQIRDLLRYPGTDIAEQYAPTGVPTRYSPRPMLDVHDWVVTRGSRIVFLYGANDPWTAGAFEVSWSRQTYRFVVPDGNHSADIAHLRAADRRTVLAALERWSGVRPAVPGPARATVFPADRPRPPL